MRLQFYLKLEKLYIRLGKMLASNIRGYDYSVYKSGGHHDPTHSGFGKHLFKRT